MRLLQRVLLIVALSTVLGLPGIAQACQVLRDPIMDISGNILVGAAVTITHTVGGALATLYTDSLCSSTTPNPVLTGVDGTFTAFVKDGVYTLTPTKTGYSFVPITNVNVFDPVLENNISAAKFSTVDLCTSTTGIIDQIGATPATLVITKPLTCSATKTVPSTLTLRFEGLGSITVSGGQTLTILSHVAAGERASIFLGAGTVAGLPEVYAAWYGAKADGVTNDAAAIQKAIDSIDTTSDKSGKVLLGVGLHVLGATTLNMRDRVVVEGKTSQLTALTYSGTAEAVLFNERATSGFVRARLTTTNSGAGVIAIHIKCLTAAVISFDLRLDDIWLVAENVVSGQHGIKIDGTGSVGVYDVLMSRFKIEKFDNPIVIGAVTGNIVANEGNIVNWGTATNDAAVAVGGFGGNNIDVRVSNNAALTDGVVFSINSSGNVLSARGFPGSAGRFFLYTAGADNVFIGEDPNKNNLALGITTQANLGTPANGSMIYCSDCTFANPCAGAGTGALAKRLNGAWRCD